MEEIYRMLEEMNPDTDFRGCGDFVEEGLLDSLDILELIERLSEKFEIAIEPDDIDPDNFASAEKIWAMVEKYRT